MPAHNEDIAAAFDEIADLLEIENANPFRVRAYRNAALTLRGLPQQVARWVAENRELEELPGIGESLAKKIREFLLTGHLKALDKLHREVPPSVEALLKIPGLGPKRVRQLYLQAGVRSVDDLEQAARSGKLLELPGFGEKSVARILAALASHRTKKKRFIRAFARQYAEPLRDWLKQAKGVDQVVIAGSYRRGRDTVGDIDVLATARTGNTVIERLVEYDEVASIVSRGGTRATVVLKCGLQVDLRVVAKRSFGAALQYFTGSKAHTIQIRRLAQERGIKINEYGVFRDGKTIAGLTEESVYKAVALAWIPPELREARGEIEAARKHRLPKLIEPDDLKGDLHCHTLASDGKADIETMAKTARAQGLEYLAITDHNHNLRIVRGIDASNLLAQIDEIDRINEKLRGVHILKGIEVNILENGQLDLDDDILCRLDLVVASVHSHYALSRRKQTERVLRAMDSRCFSILAHPTGRRLTKQPRYDIDMGRVTQQAADRGCFLELNANPGRLDLDDVNCMAAREAGILVSINSDAHSPEQFQRLADGVTQARRGWLTPGDVLNARPLEQLRALLKRTMLRDQVA